MGRGFFVGVWLYTLGSGDIVGCLGSLLVLLAVVLLGGVGVWFFLGRIIFLWVDRFFLVLLEELPVTPVEIRQGEFSIGINNWPVAREWGWDIRMEVEGGNRLVMIVDGKRFGFGAVVKCWMADQEGKRLDFQVEGDAGDLVSMTKWRSRLKWWTPFQFNILGGSVSRWRRHLYDQLVWEKSSGQKLEMVWRHEEWFYVRSGWADQCDLRLSSVRVGRDPVERIVVEYLRRTKGWGRGEYRLENRGVDVVGVVFLEDEIGAAPGAGKSVVVYVEREAGKVMKEVGWQ